MKIHPFPLFQPGKQYPIADIPNTAGFMLIALHKDGQEFPAMVQKNDHGFHYLTDMKSNRLPLTNLTGWRLPKIK